MTWRRLVNTGALRHTLSRTALVLLDGNTGTAKTALLARLAEPRRSGHRPRRVGRAPRVAFGAHLQAGSPTKKGSNPRSPQPSPTWTQADL